MPATTTEKAGSETCPSCRTRGRAVKPVTVESLMMEEARTRVGGADGFRFCAMAACDVAYFRPSDGARIACSEVRVRIGQKETGAPRPVCYCFGHTVEAIEAEVAATGTSKVADDIAEKCRQGLDRCEESNPQGACCLGNVRLAVREAQRRHAGGPAIDAAGIPPDAGEGCGAACTMEPPPTRTDRRGSAGLWAVGGAALSAILSSACCWLPLLLIAFGASAAGVAGFFEAYRPYLLGATGLLLAGGFYLVYFRKERCGPGEACAVPDRRLRRLNKAVLWVATSVVLAFALFPNYVGHLLGDGNTWAATESTGSRASRVFQIEGMTCAACASGLRARLRELPGVTAAQVDYDAAVATVALGPEGSVEAVLRAIAEQGYEGKSRDRPDATGDPR